MLYKLRLVNTCINTPYILSNKYKVICLETYIYERRGNKGEVYEHIN